MATVGTGKYTYELMEGWGRLPEGWTLGQTAIVTDSQDRVYLFNRSEHPLIVLDRDGNFLTSWGEGVLTAAHGMFMDADENLYLPVINSHVVLKYSSQGNLLMTLGTWDQPSDTGWSGDYRDTVQRAAGPFHRPSDVALSPEGEIYTSPTATATHGSTNSPPMAASCSPGAHRARPAPVSSTFLMAYGCIPTAASLWPTVRTTASKYSAPRGSS